MGGSTTLTAGIATATLQAISAAILDLFEEFYRMRGGRYHQISSEAVESRLDTISWTELRKVYLSQLGCEGAMRW